jgi:hypothetical protein
LNLGYLFSLAGKWKAVKRRVRLRTNQEAHPAMLRTIVVNQYNKVSNGAEQDEDGHKKSLPADFCHHRGSVISCPHFGQRLRDGKCSCAFDGDDSWAKVSPDTWGDDSVHDAAKHLSRLLIEDCADDQVATDVEDQ